MIVISLTDTPPKVRGDLSKWLLEVNTGVYVGNVSTRVREEIWERVCTNLNHGRATMVYTTQNEQKMDFRVHNSAWEPVDFEGLKLIRHPSPANKLDKEDNLTKKGFSNAAKSVYHRKMTNASHSKNQFREYTVIDLETTGLSYEKDRIIELAAIRVINGEISEEFNKLIKMEAPLPEQVIQLTGITNEMLAEKGEPFQSAFEQFIQFIQSDVIVCHNVSFDLNFIQVACHKLAIKMPRAFKTVDTLQMARKKIKSIEDYRLETLGKYFEMDISGVHRALKDCYLTSALYEQLNTI